MADIYEINKHTGKPDKVMDISGKEDKTNKDTDPTLAADSDVKYPSQKAARAFTNNRAHFSVMHYSGNPLIYATDYNRRDPSNIIEISGTFYIYYTLDPLVSGIDDAQIAVASAPSLVGPWTEIGVVLSKGTAGAWDDNSVYTPNVVIDGSTIYMFYTARHTADGTASIGIATSSTASPTAVFSKSGSNPVIAHSVSGFDSVVADCAYPLQMADTTWRVYYKGRTAGEDRSISFATAATLAGPYTKYSGGRIFGMGVNGSPNNQFEDPTVLYMNGLYYLLVNSWRSGSDEDAVWYVSTNGIDGWAQTNDVEPVIFDNLADSWAAYATMGYTAGTVNGRLAYLLAHGQSTGGGAMGIGIFPVEQTGGSTATVDTSTAPAIATNTKGLLVGILMHGIRYAMDAGILGVNTDGSYFSRRPIKISNAGDTSTDAGFAVTNNLASFGNSVTAGGAGNLVLNSNWLTTGTQSDPSKASWHVGLNTSLDTFTVGRRAAGVVPITNKLTLNASGDLSVSGTVTGTFIYGNGSNLTGIVNTGVAGGIQFNNSGAFGTTANLYYNSANNSLIVPDLALNSRTVFAASTMINDLTTGGTDKSLTAEQGKTLSTRIPVLTAGYIPFSTGTVYAGDAALFWDNTNKRLGIGTTTPTVPLDVYGTTSAIASILVRSELTSAAAGGSLTMRHSNASDTYAASGDRLGNIQYGSRSGGTNRNGVQLAAYAEEAFGASAAGANFRILTSNIGATTPTEKFRVSAAGLVTFANGGGLAFGHQYTNTAITIAVASMNTWYEVDATGTTFTAGALKNVTQSDHYLVAVTAGYYEIIISAAMKTSGTGDEVAVTVMVNGTASETAHGHATIPLPNQAVTAGGITILSLAANDQVSLAVENHSAARDITVSHAQITMKLIGSP